MIPLKLNLRAFGPYAGTQPIDFRELNAHRAFLITGPTGGGKTTLFDAMQYALFGETTGGERQATDMRSDHADDGTPTQVDFHFQLGAKSYRVLRSPRQLRPKARGTGFTQADPEATLWDTTGHDPDAGEAGTVIATKTTDVTQAVEALLGLRASEFRQIVVLPQDRFRALLSAETKDREEILRKLFATWLYERIQELLNKRSKAVEDEQARQRQHIQAVLEEAELDSAEALHTRIESREQELTQAKSDAAAKKTAFDAASSGLEAARALEALYQERDQRAHEVSQLYADNPRIDGLRERIKMAERSQSVVAAEEARTAAHKRLEAAGKDRDRASARKEKADAEAQRARAAFDAEQHRQDERTAAQRQVQYLEGLQPRLGRIEELEANRTKADKQLENARQQHADAERRLEAAKSRLNEADAAVRAAEQAEGQVGGARSQRDELRNGVSKHQRMTRLAEEIAQADHDIEGRAQAASTARGEREAAEHALDAALDALAHNQIGRLAQGLKPGSPCPVCGSQDHPAPATPPDVDDTAEAAPELDQARQRLTRALAAEREADQVLQSARSERAMKAANHADLVEELGARAEADAASLTQALETAEQEVTRLQSLADGLGAARAEYQAAENEHQNAETALKAAETAWYSASREQAAAQSAHDAALAELPEDLRTRAALDARLDAARTQQTELEQALETARQQKDAAEREETAAAQDAQSTESHYQEAIAGAEKADADFRRGLETAGFDTEEAYHAARADHAEIEALRAEVTDHDRKLDAAQNRIAELDTQIQERVRPDVQAHADAYEAARQALDNANAAVTLAQERLATDQGRVTRLRKIEAQIAETQEQLARVGRMARVARGDNPLGLSFERYVMTELLDAILASATQRLALMSRGRYALVRAEDTGDRRKHRGLDIAVHDDHTGKVRPASTLSGGEGFLASLALALGTSDVVQARSGGVKIDALYIDEGFGALDSETLDEAMRVILDLQRQSDRVIGMISHVSEMRERIPARLEVRSDRAGSTVHVRLP